jgi:hypothetical protein
MASLRSALGSRVLGDALLALLAVAALGFTTKVSLDPPRAPASANLVSEGPVRVLFIGGWVTSGGDDSPAAQAAASLGWRATVDDHPGAGLLQGGTDGSAPLAQQAQIDASGRSDAILVVAAGPTDLRSTADEVRLAASHVVDRLRVSVPASTALVLVAPDGDAGPAIRAALALVAREKHVHFLDPADWTAENAATTTATVRVEAAANLSAYLGNLQVRPR